MIYENISYQNRLWDRDSCYNTKEEVNRKIKREYLERMSVITGEINRREKEVYRKLRK